MTLRQALKLFGHIPDDEFPCMECGRTNDSHNDRARHIRSEHPIYVGHRVWPSTAGGPA